MSLKQQLQQVIDRRAQANARVQALAAKMGETEAGLSAEEATEFDTVSAEFDRLDAQLTRLKAAEKAEAAMAKPLVAVANVGGDVDVTGAGSGVDLGDSPRFITANLPKRAPGHAAALCVLSLAARDLLQIPRDQYLLNHNAPDISAALSTGVAADGGNIVPPDYRAELIPLLQAKAVIRSLARPIDMPVGSFKMPKKTGVSTANYIGELVVIPQSQPTFGQMQMSWKKLTSLVPISNDLIRYANPSVLSIVTADMTEQIALREDRAFLRDAGTGALPKGLLNWCLVGNKVAATNTTALTQEAAAQAIRADLMKARLKLRAGFLLNPTGVYWLISARTEEYLMSLTSSLGGKLFPEMAEGKLTTIPYRVSQQIPENLGAGTNESEIYLVNFDEVYLGDSMRLEVATSTQAVIDIGGTPLNLFQQDAMAVRMITEHDFAPRQDNAIAMLTAVKYGA